MSKLQYFDNEFLDNEYLILKLTFITEGYGWIFIKETKL